MSKWLLIPIKETGSGGGAVGLLLVLFVLAVPIGLTGALVKFAFIGQHQLAVSDFVVGAVSWLLVAGIVWGIRRQLRAKREPQ